MAILTWIIVGVLILVGFFVLKMDHHGRRVKLVVVIILGLLLIFSMYKVFSSSEVDMTSPGGIVKGVYSYFGWVGHTVSELWHVGGNTAKVVGNVVKGNSSGREVDDGRR